MAAIGVAKRIDLLFVDSLLDACARNQRSNKARVVDILSLGRKGRVLTTIIPVAAIPIGIDHYKSMPISQAVKFIAGDRASDTFRSAMNAYQGVILFQAQQSAGCHAIHSVEARLCRWLLLSQDMLGSEHVPLTQEFLSHMLGVRRTSVSLCAHTLQKSGLIQYARGNIKIQNRKGLEECACECYSAIRERIFGIGEA